MSPFLLIRGAVLLLYYTTLVTGAYYMYECDARPRSRTLVSYDMYQVWYIVSPEGSFTAYSGLFDNFSLAARNETKSNKRMLLVDHVRVFSLGLFPIFLSSIPFILYIGPDGLFVQHAVLISLLYCSQYICDIAAEPLRNRVRFAASPAELSLRTGNILFDNCCYFAYTSTTDNDAAAVRAYAGLRLLLFHDVI